ncbi:aminotransferase class I/II-fold pyridoxal phosphate-dependent enzyme [Streptomyces sp. ICN988]|uniref:aminotransferase class I/II-fold pyridoxal phosphate-dependent enzyme n=1 Tax=Streptomyces sp. ICN988 TaxID=2983765 RepID=UPI0021E4CD8E|nr:aminotransferase class I/II-fold pyridoxal phosphate-dependent enzyme [Streptomyces sp. ICN988]MCV2458423.1 aminotransferase class I/II-fold pyridoxal phosphate-dependent enzyme [Streptomyces sp. ICN988]
MLPDDEEQRLLEPLERFAALHATALRASRPGLIDMSYPNPLVHRDPRAFDLLRGVLAETDQGDLQYTPFGGGAVVRRRVAASLSRRLGLPFGFRDVLLTPGATAALNVALTALFRPDDEVVVPTPCWMDYFLYLRRLGLRPVAVPCGADKRLDMAALVSAIGPRTAGVIISQPVCPTGVLHSAEELAELSDVLRAAGARYSRAPVLISDEVHRDQIWDTDGFTSPVQVYADTVSLYSFGKAWSLQGQRTGYAAFGPALDGSAEVVARAERALRSTGFCAPTALMQRLVEDLADLTPDCGPLHRDQVLLREVLARLGYETVPGRATAFVYARCPEGFDDWTFVSRLARNGLLAMPSSLFHEPGYFRLALNVGPDRLEDVGRSLGAVLEQDDDAARSNR